jgi:hypothetical protein
MEVPVVSILSHVLKHVLVIFKQIYIYIWNTENMFPSKRTDKKETMW